MSMSESIERFLNSLQVFQGFVHLKPVIALCTKRVLVMERLVGMRLEDFVTRFCAKQRAGDLLTTAFHEMAYVFRGLHADPHGGNFICFGWKSFFDRFWLRKVF